MIKNFFVISLRNLLKRKVYTTLNILGLTIGITCCLLIFQYVSYERSYDTFQKNSSRIVRIRLDEYKQGKLLWQSATSYPAFGPLMKKDYPEVENYCRLIDDELLLSNDAKNVKFSEKKGYWNVCVQKSDNISFRLTFLWSRFQNGWKYRNLICFDGASRQSKLVARSVSTDVALNNYY